MNTLGMFATNLMILATGGTGGGTGGGTTTKGLTSFFTALTASVQSYVRIIIMLIGIVMVGVGVYQIAKNLISHGKGQTNWFVTIMLLVLGGVLMMTGGFSVLRTFTETTKNTVNDLADGKPDKDMTGNEDDRLDSDYD